MYPKLLFSVSDLFIARSLLIFQWSKDLLARFETSRGIDERSITFVLALFASASCVLQPAGAQDSLEHQDKFLHGRLEEAGSQNLPSNSFDPNLTDLGEEQPLPDYLVRRYIEPLVWVKIPKGFAGVWETRQASGSGFLRGGDDFLASQTTETTFIRNGKVRRHSIETHEAKMSSQRSNDVPPVDYSQEDHYRFFRGFQIDENGDIWDCPSIRNVQFHKFIDGPDSTESVQLYSDESLKIVSDNTISESIFSVNISELEKSQSKRLFVRNLLNDSQRVDMVETDAGACHVAKAIWHNIEYKIADFKPVDRWRGIDLKASFDEFRKRMPKG